MKLALLGDIALFGKMSVKENPNVTSYFSEIADYLKGFDYVVGNLETPFSVEKKTNGAKSAYICSDVENVKTLKQLHVNAVCLANNHMFDFGKEGYETTKQVLKDYCIDYFGTEGKELNVEIEGNRIAFSGFCCYSSNPLQCVPYGKYGVNAYNIERVIDVLRQNDGKGFLNIVAVHAGLEHVNYPSVSHVRAARMLAGVVPLIFYGHHPHVIQGVEEWKESLIAYSLGNFCFDDVYTAASKTSPLITLTENNRRGIILELTIENNKLTFWREQMIYISKEGKMQIMKNDTDALTEYNVEVEHCEENAESYIERRKAILNKRFAERKSMRNIQWYLKRLRPKYVKLIIEGRRNARLFNENVKSFIQNGL